MSIYYIIELIKYESWVTKKPYQNFDTTFKETFLTVITYV
jgi:hypothetical protein